MIAVFIGSFMLMTQICIRKIKYEFLGFICAIAGAWAITLAIDFIVGGLK